MKHKVAELEGILLDTAVATAEGLDFVYVEGYARAFTRPHQYRRDVIGRQRVSFRGETIPCYSTKWQRGGPIIERERISLHPPQGDTWSAGIRNPKFRPGELVFLIGGPTPLIAAMRAYVASKLGAEVEL